MLEEIYKSLNMDVVSFVYGPMPTQPLGWFKKPIAKVDDMKGLKFRTVGLAIDVFKELGMAVNPLPGGEIVPALDRGLIDAAEFNNASSDRLLGFPDVVKNCMLQSFHQSGEQFEILFNKAKYDALPAELKSVIDYAVQAASADMSWKAIQRNSQDYIELKKDKVNFYKTPDAILRAQLAAWDKVDRRQVGREPAVQEGAGLAEGLCPARRPVAERLHGRLQDGLEPLLPAGQEGLIVRASTRATAAARPVALFLSLPPPSPRSERDAKPAAAVDRLSTWLGQVFAWLIVVLTLMISWEVFSRYVLNSPHDWALDAQIMMYGTLFMMAGAYTLTKNGHVRGDVLYGFFRPRTQATLDLILYFLFFLPGIVALTWAGWNFASESLAIRESTFSATPLPLYPFKFIIPLAGGMLLLQGIVEIVRCIQCIRDGVWPSREQDVEEVDVDKLKAMVHVKDEDIAALDKYVLPHGSKK